MKADEMLMLDGFEELDGEEEDLRQEICGDNLQAALNFSPASSKTKNSCRIRKEWTPPKKQESVSWTMHDAEPTI